LLCEILDDEEFKTRNLDLIEIIISIGELYGYYSYIENFGKTFGYSEAIRKNMYKSNDGKIYYNSGQLSLLNEIKNENKLFISAPTTFGKTKLVLDYILLEANMKDHKNDVLLTTCTLISIIFGYFGIYLIDGIVGAIISIYILFSGFSIFLESYKILMDISLNKEEKELKYKYVREVTMNQNIFERLFNIGTIKIFTNASSGGYPTRRHNNMQGKNGIYIHCVENVKEQYETIKGIIDEGTPEE